VPPSVQPKKEEEKKKEAKENDVAATKPENKVPVLLNPSKVKDCEDTDIEEEQCGICLTKKRNVLSSVCYHRCICLFCAQKELPRKCIVCQTATDTWVVSV
jgi:hypothetical protein